MKVMMKMLKMMMSLVTIVMKVTMNYRSICATVKPWNVSAQCIPQ